MQLKIRHFFDNKISLRIMWVGIAAIVAFQLYFVRELFAALILFTVVFLAIAAIAFGIYLLDEGSKFGFDWAAIHSKSSLQYARRAWPRVEDLTRKQLERIRSFHGRWMPSGRA